MRLWAVTVQLRLLAHITAEKKQADVHGSLSRAESAAAAAAALTRYNAVSH